MGEGEIRCSPQRGRGALGAKVEVEEGEEHNHVGEGETYGGRGRSRWRGGHLQ